ncbi:MAG: OadG family protein [Draconibacterium sp.]|jgi:oxaloacetate decarboxylase gamma subunit
MAEALNLLVTGMGTVFFILIMVVALGNLIIRVTNMLYIEPVIQEKKSVSVTEIAPSKLAAIVSAVDVVTKGKGKVTSVEKMEK